MAGSSGEGKGRIRVTATLTPELDEQLRFWADKRGMSVNKYLALAIQRSIAFEASDFDVPTAIVARMNQLVDLNRRMERKLDYMDERFTQAMESFIGLVRGDNNYLRDEDAMPSET